MTTTEQSSKAFPGPYVGYPPGSDLFVFLNVSTAGTAVKTGAGSLRNVIVSAAVAGTLTLYDGTNTSGTVIASISTGAQFFAILNVQFNTGLYIAQTAAASVTITYC